MANKVEKVMCGASDLGIACDGALSLGGVARSSDLHSKGNLGVARKMNNMNKLMIASAMVAAAFAVSADVTSANVVGYANKMWTEGNKNKMVCSQFQIIGKEASQMKLSDLVPGGEWLPVEDIVKVFRDDSGVKFNAFYVDEETAKSMRNDGMDWVHAGWWNADSPEEEFCTEYVGDETLPLGGTIMAYAVKKNAFIASAGEVVESETGKIRFTWAVGNINMMVGNCTPLDLILDDFVPGGEWLPVEDIVKVFRDDSGVKFNAFYVDEETAKSMRNDGMDWVHAGWWNADSPEEEFCTEYVGDEPMPAGCGIMAYAVKKNAHIEIPSAL